MIVHEATKTKQKYVNEVMLTSQQFYKRQIKYYYKIMNECFISQFNNIPITIPRETASNNLQFQLCHINAYQLSKKIVEGRSSTIKTSNIKQTHCLKLKRQTQKQRSLFKKQINYQQNSFVNKKLNNSSINPSHKIYLSSRKSSLKPRYSTQASDYKHDDSPSHLRHEYEIPRINSYDLLTSPNEANNAQQKQVKFGLMRQIGNRRKKITINELLSRKNKVKRQYQLSKLSRIDIIPDYIQYSKTEQTKRQSFLIKTISNKKYSNYQIQHHQD